MSQQQPDAMRPAALVTAANFILATRETGYRSTAHAVAELVDNSLQAEATHIAIEVLGGHGHALEIRVTDNGAGMDATTLAAALSFGGSTRFGDRSSLGRYGMGLPNGALSRARRLEVFTWQHGRLLMSSLDVDEIISTGDGLVGPISEVGPLDFLPETPHGTLVRLLRCDRVEWRRPSTLAGHLRKELGRIYRRFLVDGLEVRVNGEPIHAIDPLFLHPQSEPTGGRQFGSTLEYQLSGPTGPGAIELRFSELPIERWHSLTNDEKRRLGVSHAPCVSVVRAGREIDAGWYFMGTKRRENYDDWWRCEVSFEPTLDELFGVTNTKQGITPRPDLVETLAVDCEPVARALNGRVRRTFDMLKAAKPIGAAEQQAARTIGTLPPLPRNSRLPEELAAEFLSDETADVDHGGGPYRILVRDLPTTSAFELLVNGGRLTVILNSGHPLYRDLYGPLALSDAEEDQEFAKRIALALLAAARAEVHVSPARARGEIRRFRQAWADVIATFFNA
jgi:hypothetical protein